MVQPPSRRHAGPVSLLCTLEVLASLMASDLSLSVRALTTSASSWGSLPSLASAAPCKREEQSVPEVLQELASTLG